MTRRDRSVIVEREKKRERDKKKKKTIFVHSRETMIKYGICVQQQRWVSFYRLARLQFQSNECAQQVFHTSIKGIETATAKQRKKNRKKCFDTSSLLLIFSIFFFFLILVFFFSSSFRFVGIIIRPTRMIVSPDVWCSTITTAVLLYSAARSLSWLYGCAANQLHKKEARIIVKSNKIAPQNKKLIKNMRRFSTLPSLTQQWFVPSRLRCSHHILVPKRSRAAHAHSLHTVWLCVSANRCRI